MPGDLLSSSFRCKFEDGLTPSQQQQAIDSLQDYIHEVQYGTDDQRRDLGVIEDDDEDAEVIAKKSDAFLEKCYWQLVMFLKSSKPTLIATAEPYLRFLLESQSVKSDPTHTLEILALLHLAAALASPPPSKAMLSHSPAPLGFLETSGHLTAFHSDHTQHTQGPFDHFCPAETRDAEALALFERGFALYETVSRSRGSSPSPSARSDSALGLDVAPQTTSPTITPASPTFAFCVPTSPRVSFDSPRSHHRLSGICGRKGKLPPKTELWARASYVRLLRRLAQTADDADAREHMREAARQVEFMRTYVRENPYALPHERYETFLHDLERDFDVAIDVDAAQDVLTSEPPVTRQPSPLRFAGLVQTIGMPSPSMYPSVPPSSSSSSCSSASTSSSASPQTPFTPLSPANTFTQPLHDATDKVTTAFGGMSLAIPASKRVRGQPTSH